MSDPDTQSVMAPPLGLTARGVWMMTGLVWFLFSLSCITVGLLYSDSCPRHPTLAIWLVVMGVILTLLSLSLSLLNLPAFYTKARVTARPPADVKISACTVLLLFLTCLLSILILLTLISWLSVGTFWLFHSGPRLPGEYEVRPTSEPNTISPPGLLRIFCRRQEMAGGERLNCCCCSPSAAASCW